MKEKILQMVDAYWKFDEAQQPMISWHDKQDLLKALEELLQPAVIKSLSDLDGKTMLVKFKVSKFQPKITLDEVQRNDL